MIYGCSLQEKAASHFSCQENCIIMQCNGILCAIHRLTFLSLSVSFALFRCYTYTHWMMIHSKPMHASACMNRPFYGAFFMLILQPINYTSSIGRTMNKRTYVRTWHRTHTHKCECERIKSKCCDVRYIYPNA